MRDHISMFVEMGRIWEHHVDVRKRHKHSMAALVPQAPPPHVFGDRVRERRLQQRMDPDHRYWCDLAHIITIRVWRSRCRTPPHLVDNIGNCIVPVCSKYCVCWRCISVVRCCRSRWIWGYYDTYCVACHRLGIATWIGSYCFITMCHLNVEHTWDEFCEYIKGDGHPGTCLAVEVQCLNFHQVTTNIYIVAFNMSRIWKSSLMSSGR